MKKLLAVLAMAALAACGEDTPKPKPAAQEPSPPQAAAPAPAPTPAPEAKAPEAPKPDPNKELAQRVKDLRCVLGPQARVFLEAGEDQVLELAWDRHLRPLGWGHRGGLKVVQEHFHGRVPGENELARQQVVSDTSQRVNVRPLIDLPSQDYLRRHERWRSRRRVRSRVSICS